MAFMESVAMVKLPLFTSENSISKFTIPNVHKSHDHESAR